MPEGQSVNFFSSLLSIDLVADDSIAAYANAKQFVEFLKLDIPFRVLPPPSIRQPGVRNMNLSLNPITVHYPSYNEYVDTMEQFAASYPNLCRLVEFGESVKGHKLLALKISGNPGLDEDEPGFLYTSTIHGDEVTGYVLMLYLIKDLLENYNSDTLIKDLVDHVEIWINPLANPDGTFFMSDTSVYGATRFNANNIDLNRNFPDPADGDHPDGNAWQPETRAMMDFMNSHPIVLAANFHGGSEVVNYPWDTWARLHADDAWYRFISGEYADTAHAYAPEGYMTDLDNGITNGYAWYRVTGGRQDYHNYYLHGREVTIELSHNKMPDESELPQFWESNRRSLLDFMKEVLYGVSGTVRDSVTGNPLHADISVIDHDKDSSDVKSSGIDGSYYRLISGGSYVFTYTAPGYFEKSMPISINNRQHIEMDVRMRPIEGKPYQLYPNPFKDELNFIVPESGKELIIEIYDLSGRKITEIHRKNAEAGIQSIPVQGLKQGAYIIKFIYGNATGSRIYIKAGL